jgi:acyl-CoA synthetase (AMP-forming)/AMP-acid ligase II
MSVDDFVERFEHVCRDARSSLAALDLTAGRSLTFGGLHDEYQIIVRALDGLRLPPGSPIVTLVGNRPVFFALVAACMSRRLTLIPLGDATDEEAVSVVKRSAARAVATDRALPLSTLDQRTLPDGTRIMALPEAAEPAAHREAVILKLTSGSTDVPKAAVAGFQHLVADGRHIIEAMAIEPSDVNFSCVPLSHAYALGNVVMPLLLQGTAAVLRQSFNPAQLIADVQATGATIFPGVPFMFDRFRSMKIERVPECLRLLITAGARIDPATVAWFTASADRKIHSLFGSSETGSITYDDSDDVPDPLHVGRPMPETTVRILGAGADGRGRIFVSGSAVASSYATAPDAASLEAPDDSLPVGFRDGGFLTGDVGYFDAGGELILTGRVSSSVNVAGRKVNPAEIEQVLRELPGVADVLVMGASCERRGQRLVAFVVSDQALNPVDLRQRCARMLSPHKIPREFIFLDEIPLDARGKLDRRALEALAAAAPGGSVA